MTKAQMGAVALVQGDRSFPSLRGDARRDGRGLAAARSKVVAPRRVPQLQAARRRHVDLAVRHVPQSEEATRPSPAESFSGLWDDVPKITMPTTLVRGAKSFFVNDDDAAQFAEGAPGFQRTHVVDDSGHSVQGDQPAALVDIFEGCSTPDCARVSYPPSHRRPTAAPALPELRPHP